MKEIVRVHELNEDELKVTLQLLLDELNLDIVKYHGQGELVLELIKKEE